MRVINIYYLLGVGRAPLRTAQLPSFRFLAIMYHARNMLIPLVLRQSTAVLRRTHYPTSLRQFSVTPPPQAAENEDSFISKFKNTSVFQQLADKPDALAAIQKFAQLLQSSGALLVYNKLCITDFCLVLDRHRDGNRNAVKNADVTAGS